MPNTVLMWPRATPTAKTWNDFESGPLDAGTAYIVKADVTGFYESIDHRLLQEVLVTLTGKIELVEALVDFLGRVMRSPRGLPQGLTTSDVLATAYLSEVDAQVIRVIHHYWRHGDDIRMAVNEHSEGKRAVHHLEEQLRNHRLLLNADKTRVLLRGTYETQLRAVERRREKIGDKLRSDLQDRVADGSLQNLDEVIERVGATIEPRMTGPYDPEIDLDDLAEQLGPHLRPAEIEIAREAFREAVEKAPGTPGVDTLTKEEFHGLLKSSLPTLLADKSAEPIAAAPMVVERFPDKTRVIADYLRGVAVQYPQQVTDAALKILSGGYVTGLQKALMCTVLRQVATAPGGITTTTALDAVREIVEGEAESWLARAEGIEVLAEAGSLTRELLMRVWNRAPEAVRANLVAAVATAATRSAPWAVAFRDSLNADPLMQVIIHSVRQQREAQTSESASTATPELEDPTNE